MAGRRHAAPAFRPSAPSGRGRTPSRAQAVALLSGLIVLAAAVAVASFVVKPSRARSFDLFYGSIFINDDITPVAVDLASGKPTVRLRNARIAVSAKTSGDLQVVPLAGGNTLMLNSSTGEFNMVDSTGFVVKPTDGGVRLPAAPGVTRTSAVPSDESAYMLQSSPSRTTIDLVGEPTVSAAVGGNTDAKPRAFGTIDSPITASSSPAAAANGDLWLLTDRPGGQSHVITQFSVPDGSNTGALLDAQSHGSVSGRAAVGTATLNADGSGGDVAAVATSDRIRIFGATAEVTRPITVGAGVDVILPATDAQGQLAFLYHSASGWSRVTARTDGRGSAQVTKLDAIDPDARLITPAQSDGRLYTMDTTGSGDLWQIDATGAAHPIEGAAHYPVLTGEKGDLSDSEVVSRGSRVIFNARANYQAEVVFSDGSHEPRTIDKHSAVQVDPTGATTLADAHSRPGDTGKTTTKPAKAPPHPAQAINDKIDCRTTTQKPNIPTLIAGERASRSIAVSWTYPLLENADCLPSTYVVSIKVITPGAPSTEGTVSVQGQNGVTITGLFPATEYELRVSAYINKVHTDSAPIRVSTGAEGPAAATNVRATTTSSGDWTISWNSCGGVGQGCVPSTSWNIIPRFCDGRGLSGVPATLSVTEDSTIHSFQHTYPGSDALLGRGLCFAVQGVSPQGTIGAVSASTPPVYSWSPPIAGDLHLTASQPARTSLGGSASTSVDLSLGSDPVRTVGGVGATVTFALTGPGGTQTKTVTFDGRSDVVSTSFPGIQAGAQYTAQATVHPPNHPAVSATTPVVTVTTRADWPALAASANCPPDGGPFVLSCTLTVRIGGLSSDAAGGELFTLTDGSNVVCGSNGFGLKKSDFDPARDVISSDVSLLQFSGRCTVNLALREGANARTPAVFGGTTSPAFSTTVDLGQASTLDATRGDFSTNFVNDNGAAAAVVHYDGNPDAPGRLATDWHEQVFAPSGTACGAASNPPDATVDIAGSCVMDEGDKTGWTVTVSYRDRRDGTQHTVDGIAVPGTPPGFIPPCVLTASNFDAAWAGTADAPAANVTFDGSGADLRGCSNFMYTLQEPVSAAKCNSVVVGDTPNDAAIDALPCQSDLSLPGQWQVSISFDTQRAGSRSITVNVSGEPPAPTPTPTTTSP